MDLLREQHAFLLAARPDKRPGMFKERPDYAGGYAFIDPDLLTSTLLHGFDGFAPVTDAFQRAVAPLPLIIGCHLFDAGHGRMARLLGNAAPPPQGRSGIVIPTGYRNDSLAGLSSVSNQAGRGEGLLSVLEICAKWTIHTDRSTCE